MKVKPKSEDKVKNLKTDKQVSKHYCMTKYICSSIKVQIKNYIMK